MFPLPPAWTHETRLLSEAGIPELWDTLVPIISGTFINSVYSSLLSPWAKGNSINPKALHRPLPLYDQARRAKAWVEVEDKAHKLGLQGPRGVFMSSHLRLRLQISRLFRVHFCSFAYGQEYYLILMHLIHSLLHHV